MKLGIRYATTYRYQRAVRFSPHDVRLFPRDDRFVRTCSLDFETDPATAVRFQRDVFDNIVASCFFAKEAEALHLKLAAEIELTEKNPFDFVLAREATELPFTYEPEMIPVLAPYCQRQSPGNLNLAGWDSPQPGATRGTVSALVELTRIVHEQIGYERREEGSARGPAETLQMLSGACRDISVLLAELLRELGLAARLVSGYLREADDEMRYAEGALHAWTEVYLPGAGWIGLDPTNGIFCNHNFIAAAVGLTPADITPISGSFYHRDRVPAQMTSRLELLNRC